MNNSKSKAHSLPKINGFLYSIIKFLAVCTSKLIFRNKRKRNEIKGKKGPFVVIANHQAALDFCNIIGATREKMHFVISNSFYNTLPARGIVDRLGLIPKQQFQTSLSDMQKMRSVLKNGKILVIYPAGLMCEDGRSTPIPDSTYRFLKWLKADVYVAKTEGTYFIQPKWSKKMRKGRTYIDIYKLFSKTALEKASDELVKEKVQKALNFDAYHTQENYLERYKGGDNVEGLEDVIYMGPCCKREFTVSCRDKSVLYCRECGYAEKSDEYCLFHKESENGKEIRHASAWSRMIYDDLKYKIHHGEEGGCRLKVIIQLYNEKKRKYTDAGEGILSLDFDYFNIQGKVSGEPLDINIHTSTFASLPFKPGKYIEIQHGQTSYRCFPEDGRYVMKFVNTVKIFYEMHCHNERMTYGTKP